MKTFCFIVAFAAAAALCPAQDESPDHVTVPLADPSRPAKVIASCINGRITVHTGANGEVAVDAKGGSGRRHGGDREGLHRIDMSGSGLSIDQSENTITIGTHALMMNSDISLRVPVNTSLKLKSVMGDVIVDGVSGDIEVESTNGRMTLTNISGAALVHGVNGAIIATFTHTSGDKPMSFSSLNGDIDITLPADTHARLKMKTTNGDAYTDFDVALQPQSSNVEDSGNRNGRRHITIDHSAVGTINGGGPEFQLVTFNGNIKVRKAH